MTEWDEALMHNDLEAIRTCYDKLQERIDIMEHAKKTIHDNVIEPQRQKLEAIQGILSEPYTVTGLLNDKLSRIREVLGE